MTSSRDLLAQLRALHPSLIDLSLGRIERLLTAMGRPQDHVPPVIHVAGTNGKGSVIAYLSAILQAAGLRVHAFTSPHLQRFHERIALAGPQGTAPISETDLVSVLERTAAANGQAPITFFEITTAAAFLAFAERPADVLLLETGLGGRLDATNVIARPALTILTPISYDHMAFLGDSLAKIAGEKAGILKPGVPATVAPQEREALSAISDRAAAIGAPLFVAGQDWDVYEQHGRLVYQDDRGLLDLPLPALPGRHQVVNAGTALAALRQLAWPPITDDAMARGLVEARWPARLQRLGPGALWDHLPPQSEIWLDGGHNPAAAAALAQTMADLEERVPRPLVLLVGMMERKDPDGFLTHFAGLARHVATVPLAENRTPRWAEKLAETARRHGLSAHAHESLHDALKSLGARAAGQPVRLLICGSLYLAGEVLDAHGHAPAAE